MCLYILNLQLDLIDKYRFPLALDNARGTCEENRTYLLKEGKWTETGQNINNC